MFEPFCSRIGTAFSTMQNRGRLSVAARLAVSSMLENARPAPWKPWSFSSIDVPVRALELYMYYCLRNPWKRTEPKTKRRLKTKRRGVHKNRWLYTASVDLPDISEYLPSGHSTTAERAAALLLVSPRGPSLYTVLLFSAYRQGAERSHVGGFLSELYVNVVPEIQSVSHYFRPTYGGRFRPRVLGGSNLFGSSEIRRLEMDMVGCSEAT